MCETREERSSAEVTRHALGAWHSRARWEALTVRRVEQRLVVGLLALLRISFEGWLERVDEQVMAHEGAAVLAEKLISRDARAVMWSWRDKVVVQKRTFRVSLGVTVGSIFLLRLCTFARCSLQFSRDVTYWRLSFESGHDSLSGSWLCRFGA